ncbi:hypothetical protein TRIUR3_28780 [Triticum urartu]|uniref:Uncharacterized protein n=1 Tax=Triticum urartu TaxID=4572 RepID=M7YHB5_TRIUA|nr:hypothetical protein TRIUR3_28780 [Triticum urartu]
MVSPRRPFPTGKMSTDGLEVDGIFGGPSAWSGFVLPVESQDSMSIVNAAMGAARKTLEPCGEAAGYEVFSEDTSGWTRSRSGNHLGFAYG